MNSIWICDVEVCSK